MYIIFQVALSDMPSTDSFPTKCGTVRVTDDAVHIEESFSGYMQSLYAEYWKSDTWRQKAIFAGYILGFVFGVWGIVNLIRSGEYQSSPNRTARLASSMSTQQTGGLDSDASLNGSSQRDTVTRHWQHRDILSLSATSTTTVPDWHDELSFC